jgi:hypothetical protein
MGALGDYAVIFATIAVIICVFICLQFIFSNANASAQECSTQQCNVDIMYHSSRCWGDEPTWDCCGQIGEKASGCMVLDDDMEMFHHPRRWNDSEKFYECCRNRSKLSKGCKNGFHPNPYGKGI